MINVIFSKYNRERLPKFQIETVLFEQDGKFRARKRALKPEAEEHINSIHYNYELLKSSLVSLNIAKATLVDRESIEFDYIDSPIFEAKLIQALEMKDRNLFFLYLNRYKQVIDLQKSTQFEEFIPSKEFGLIFGGNAPLKNVKCSQITNIDFTFDNLAFDRDEFTVIDYEWVFEFYVPVNFIIFRAINEFASRNNTYLLGLIQIDEIYELFGINLVELEIFKSMESHFQNFVFGQGREFLHTKLVKKEAFPLQELQSQVQELISKNKSIKVLLNEKNELAEKLNQNYNSLQLKYDQQDKLIENKEIELANAFGLLSEKDNELQEMQSHVDLLLQQERKLTNIYNSSGWNMLLKYYKLRDKIIPQNSKRRIASKLIFKTLKNPKMMFSKLNKSNLKKLKYYLRSEEATQLENRIDNYIERHTESSNVTSIQLYDKNEYQHIEFEHFENPKVSIVIPVYNQWHYTYSCLASIKANTNELSYEIIIADDMSTDETVNISQYISNIKVVRDGMNRGFLLNCNNAAQHAKGEYIFFLNNDTNVQPNWLSSLVDLIESNTSIGVVGSKLVYPDGRQQEAGGIIWNDASGWNYGRLDDPEKAEYNYVKEVDYISGAAILVRHDLWREIGGFDERYVPAYFEDTDLAFEIRKLGYKVVFQPESVIVHFEGISHGTDTNSGIKKYQVENKEKFFEKWKDVLLKESFPNGENVFLARDRSRDKKTVVIVDHYVPHFDKDAGGRCTYFYTKLMVSMGYHVIFIGDNFFRHEPYTTALQQLGVEVLYGNDYAKNINQWIRLNGQYVDYVYLNRPHISIKYMDTFKKHTKAKIIYFGHDLHYLREMRNYELTQNASLLKSAEEWREIEFKLFGLADVIHVVGTYEQQVLKEQLPDKLIRNIPLYPYETIYGDHHTIPSFDERQDLLFVGGFNHKPNYDGILWFINEILPTIKATYPNVKLYIVGSNPPDDIKEKSSKDIIVTGYVTDEELERYYNSCRIVVVPLRFGAGVKGKVVEAIHYEVPVVTTTIGAEGLAETEDVLVVCDEASEFANKVINLYSNQTEWQSRSLTSGDYVRKFFTVKAAQEILALDMGD